MITVINLNAAVDKRYELTDIQKGKVMRARKVENTAGGKGLHVANVVTILGEDVLATGFLGGKTGEFIEEKLAKMVIKNDFVKIAGATRECLAFITDDLIQTEILEEGPSVTKEELDLFLKKYDEILDKSTVIVASGSIPSNVCQDIYEKLINRASRANKKFLLDTSGQLLVDAIRAKPYFIKPNIDELEAISGRKISDELDILKEITKLNEKGIKCVVVSMGKDGSLVGFEGEKYKVQVPKITAVNPVGSGDAFVAGFAVGLHRNYQIEEILTLAAACGTANAMHSQTGFVKAKVVKDILSKVTIKKL